MNELIERSKGIFEQAVRKFNPYAVVLMFSGGDDSLTAYYVAKALGINIDYIVHGNTRTGIPETTDFVRQFAIDEGVRYIEADAGSNYEDYVLRKGFFGVGQTAHQFSFHVLKYQVFRSAIAHNIRMRKRNRNVLMLNGARLTESENRSKNLTDVFNRDPGTLANIWVNIIHHWEKRDCLDFLNDCKARRNPVSQKLCRSGECMCGTMQSRGDREEAVFFYPGWAKWLDDLEKRVFSAGHLWGWGEEMSRHELAKKQGQLEIPFPDFQPACTSCIKNRPNIASNKHVSDKTGIAKQLTLQFS